MALTKEQIRQIIKENNLKEVTDVQKLLKESFKEVLQEILEAELDVTLGYLKNNKGEVETDNKRNGHSSKTVKSEYGEIELDVPRDRNGEFAPQTINNAIHSGSAPQVRQQKINGKIYRYTNNIYFADVHFHRYEENRANCGCKPKWLECEGFLNWADQKMLEDKWSPDACVGYAKRQGLYPDNEIPSTKSLYHWIDSGIMKTHNLDLLEKLSRKPSKSEPKTHRNKRVLGKRVLGKSIEQRPKEVDTREEFGHWEIDTVIGLKQASDSVLLTLVERKTRFEWILKIAAKTEEAVDDALYEIFADDNELKRQVFKSCTADNGSEFAGISELAEGLKVYFCHPYASYERGSSENQHELIRRFIPKETPIGKISDIQIKRITQWINDYPRRILGYDTAYNVFMQEIKKMDPFALAA